MDQIERVARIVAAKGRDHVARLSAIIARAGELTGDPAFIASMNEVERSALQITPYGWEAEEEFVIGAPQSIFLASVEDYATGEGSTVTFFATRVRSEAECRRRLAMRIDVESAHRASIGQHFDALIPFSELLVPNALRNAMRDIEEGPERPGEFSFFATFHLNYA